MKNRPIIIECPRDAMQGIESWIPTQDKIRYINQLLKAGFDTIDFGSFVSPKAIPQLKDTSEVLEGLDLSATQSKLLAIVANVRGAETATAFQQIDYLGFPFSISETFQQRNTNSSIEESVARVAEIQNLCLRTGKKLVVYISMGFGNPYNDPWDPEIAIYWSERLYRELGIRIIALSDTIGVAQPNSISSLFTALIPSLPEVEFGAHLHTTPDSWKEKITSAWESGCRRFDGAIKGYGGCPMATDDLTGNMPTENLISYFAENQIGHGIDMSEFTKAMHIAGEIFPNH